MPSNRCHNDSEFGGGGRVVVLLLHLEDLSPGHGVHAASLIGINARAYNLRVEASKKNAI